MVLRDNIVVHTTTDKLLLMNTVTFRRKLINKEQRKVLESIISNKGSLDREEMAFLKSLEDEKQILPKDIVDMYSETLIADSKKEVNEENSITPSIILTYNCNCNCSYCYQKDLLSGGSPVIMTKGHIDGIDEFYKKYSDFYNIKEQYKIGITGGEPFQSGTEKILDYIFLKWNDAEFSFTTNGINIPRFIRQLPLERVKNFKISLDGIKDVHDRNRPMKNGKGSFDNVMHGIEVALLNKIPVELKVTVDRHSILDLPELLSFLDNQGLLNNPLLDIGMSGVFSIKDGIKLDENYNSDVEMIENYLRIRTQDSRVDKIGNNLLYGIGLIESKLVRSINRRLKNKIYRCNSLIKPFYTFDPFGDIYMCPTCIRSDIGKLGTFYPTVNLDIEKVEKLRERHVLALEKCKSCVYRFICRGGCPASAFLKNGEIMSEDCGFYKNQTLMDGVGKMFL